MSAAEKFKEATLELPTWKLVKKLKRLRYFRIQILFYFSTYITMRNRWTGVGASGEYAKCVRVINVTPRKDV